jgi:hypothetical protein
MTWCCTQMLSLVLPRTDQDDRLSTVHGYVGELEAFHSIAMNNPHHMTWYCIQVSGE